MKRLIITTAFVLAFSISISAANASENKCKGDAARATPPVVNYPTHIQNIVWRNTRAKCLEYQARMVNQSKPCEGSRGKSSDDQ